MFTLPITALKPLSGTQEVRKLYMKVAEYSIYPLTELDKLIYSANSAKNDKIRFVIKSNYASYFGLEGPANGHSVPSHRNIANNESCFSAGDLEFSIQEGKIILLGINHKSGGYRTSFDSLQFMLGVLLLNPLPKNVVIADQFYIEELNSVGGILKKHTKTKVEWMQWSQKTFTAEDKQNFLSQPTEIILPESNLENFTPKANKPPIKGRCLFEEDGSLYENGPSSTRGVNETIEYTPNENNASPSKRFKIGGSPLSQFALPRFAQDTEAAANISSRKINTLLKF